MTTTERDNSIRKNFRDLIAGPESLDVQYPNAPFEEPLDEIWATMTIIDGETTQASVGKSKRFRTIGIMVIQIKCPAGMGDDQPKELAEKIKAAHRSIARDGVVWRSPTIKALGRDGKWWVINVSCPFYSDEVVP
jgi:hypothetical protein